MRILLMSLLFASTFQISHAASEPIFCTFAGTSAEVAWLDVTYIEASNLVVVEGEVAGPFEFRVAAQLTSAEGLVKLADRRGLHSLEINKEVQGRDGISPYVYPYSAVWNGQHVGGCFTQSNPKQLAK